MNSSSENLPEYLPLNDLVTRSRGQVVRLIPEEREREERRRRKGEKGRRKGINL